VWPEKSRGVPPRELKYRFAWTFPLVFSPHDPKTLYAGGNRVFRTRDEGANWEAISPDLSLNDPTRQGHSGGPLTHDTAGAEVHATCACVTPSAHREAEIWASTDDGLVHVTRDGGSSWKKVTPKGLPELAYVGCVEISAHDADTVYVSATRYKLADYQPYLFRTTNGGRTWQSITGDLPKGEITRVVRADPVRPGLLFVGTETGIFYTLDDGAHWTRMGGGLPVAPVYDLKIKHGDLIAATHGRSFWILDDLSALRQLRDDTRAIQLVTPRETVRTKLTWSAGSGYGKSGISYGPAFGISGGSEMVTKADGSSSRQFLDVGEGAPNGAILHWWLPEGFTGAVRLTILDAKGQVVRVLASDDKALAAGRRPGTRAGLNRYVWDLRHTGPVRQDPSLNDRRNKPLSDDKEELHGPLVAPGRYTVVLEAGKQRLEAGLTVVKDPRVKTSQRAFEQQQALLLELSAKWSALNTGVNQLRAARRSLRALLARLAPAQGAQAALAARAQAMVDTLGSIESVLVDPKRESVRDVLRHQAGMDDQLADMVSVVAIADEAPTTPAREVSREAMAQVDAQLARLAQCCGPELEALNAALREAGVEVVAAGA
jgi:hypothetical protein